VGALHLVSPQVVLSTGPGAPTVVRIFD